MKVRSLLSDGDTSTDHGVYRIVVRGRLDESWSNWFDGMAIVCVDGLTELTGVVVDQSALHGILARIRDLNLILVSVDLVQSKSNNAC